jgi:hypothetical protein
MPETFTVATRGYGKSDYSREVSLGQVRPGISLKYNQQLVAFAICLTDVVPMPYPIPWVKAPLASGATIGLYDISTGLTGAYSIGAGYALSIIEIREGSNQDFDSWLYFDGLLIARPASGASGVYDNSANIAQYSTLQLDPTASLPHTVNIQVINRGLGNMRAGITITCLLEAMGTPPFPTEKDTKCPFCDTINHVSVTTTNIKCKKCGNTYIVFDMTRIKKM